MGRVVDAPGRVPEALPEGLVAASIKMFRDEKNFGFVRVDGVKGDVFFHGRAWPRRGSGAGNESKSQDRRGQPWTTPVRLGRGGRRGR